MPTSHLPGRSLLRTSVRVALATFFVGGGLWVWADLKQFEPVTGFVALESLFIWATLGWIPSLGMGGVTAGVEVLAGRHPTVKRRYGGLLLIAALVMTGLWVRSMEIQVEVKHIRVDTAIYAKHIRQEGEAVESGEIEGYLDSYMAPRSRYVALRTLQARRIELRQGERWSTQDLVAIEGAALEALESSHQPLRGLALETLIWARLEGLMTGEMNKLLAMEELPPGMLVEWLTDWEKPGRPRLEGSLSPRDLAAIEDWSAAQLPAALPALRWALEQSGEGAVSGFLGRARTDAALGAVMRAWCTTEGWSPLSQSTGISTGDRDALEAALDRLSGSEDPSLARAAVVQRAWVERVVRVRPD